MLFFTLSSEFLQKEILFPSERSLHFLKSLSFLNSLRFYKALLTEMMCVQPSF